ncbi:MAG: hybrid sensor histidine kinase/response regulator [Elusimicrobia bacterium]|nr:hybrid sensor histidine kinase/response regulator [Elusimicrobiota bacterium]
MTKKKPGTLKILIADSDQAFVSSFIQRLKQSNDFESTAQACASSRELLDEVYRQSYDLIFLDVDAPGMDSLEILAKLGQTTLPLPIVVMARSNDARIAVEAMKRGVLDYLIKDDLLTLDLTRFLHRVLETFHLKRENAELHHISQMKDDFLATISHELRTPLTSILGLSEVLLAGRMGDLQEKQVEGLRKILDQSQNLVRLINQLLDIRALTYESSKMEMSSLSLRDLVKKKVESVQTLFEKQGVRFIYMDSSDPLPVMAHSGNLAKVMDQLVSNALKFTPSGGTVRVELKRLESGYSQMKVEDTGRGIPPEALSYVFQKFFHADQSLTRPYGGMGLGLAFCKEVVEAHGGRIWVESKGTNQGTSVSFLLPLVHEHAKPEAPAAPKRAEPLIRTVLWVDDNPSMLELVEYGFASFSNAVSLVTAQGGVSALEKMKTLLPDLIVLDIMMTDMDGLEVLERLKRDPRTRDIPVLIVTGYLEAARAAVSRGASDFCLKPFRVQEVMKKIDSLLASGAKLS